MTWPDHYSDFRWSNMRAQSKMARKAFCHAIHEVFPGATDSTYENATMELYKILFGYQTIEEMRVAYDIEPDKDNSIRNRMELPDLQQLVVAEDETAKAIEALNFASESQIIEVIQNVAAELA